MNPIRLLVCQRFCPHISTHDRECAQCAGYLFLSRRRRIDFLVDSISLLDPEDAPLFALFPDDPRLEDFRKSCPQGCGRCDPKAGEGSFEPCGGFRVFAGLLSVEVQPDPRWSENSN